MSWIAYSLFRIFTFPIQFLPYSVIYRLGLILGLCIYHCYPKFRKRALSNLALATELNLKPDEIVKLAKESMQNLAILFLEYPKLYHEKKISNIATCET